MTILKSKCRFFVFLPAIGAAVLFLFAAWAGSAAERIYPTMIAASSSASPALPPPAKSAAGPQRVMVGLYLQNVHEVDLKTSSVHAELYLWFVWKGSINPTLSLLFTNVVGWAEFSKTPIYVDDSGAPKPEVFPDGSQYQVFHIEGRFGQSFVLTDYPMDSQQIAISIEEAKSTSDKLAYDIDATGSKARPGLVIPGWNVGTMKVQPSQASFDTTFGYPGASGVKDTFSHVDFVFPIERPIVGLLSKTVAPIAIIILITLGAFLVPLAEIGTRLTMTITALIAAVAMQFTTATDLPPTGYLVLLDKVYLLSYAMILLVTFESIVIGRIAGQEQIQRAKRINRIGGWFSTLAYFVVLALMLVLH